MDLSYAMPYGTGQKNSPVSMKWQNGAFAANA
jgi:hypothetical protein